MMNSAADNDFLKMIVFIFLFIDFSFVFIGLFLCCELSRVAYMRCVVKQIE